ncbi:hypothetical protein ASD03_37010 [Ensifer sp. Root127]|nr:hypothetical protein ASD03_37010 [Ensifer sp. Root127]
MRRRKRWRIAQRSEIRPFEGSIMTTKLRTLTPEEHATLQAYALENGRRWKSKLREDWMNARTTGILQVLRNSHGPSWLVSYSQTKRSPPSEGQ